MSKAIEPKNWESFLTEFSNRNRKRRARFNIFRISGGTEEEMQEAALENVSFKKENTKSAVIIERIDAADNRRLIDTIEDVRGIAVQYETDGSENVLEITDKENALISLRLESKIDGNS